MNKDYFFIMTLFYYNLRTHCDPFCYNLRILLLSIPQRRSVVDPKDLCVAVVILCLLLNVVKALVDL